MKTGLLRKLMGIASLLVLPVAGCVSTGSMVADGATALLKEVASAVSRQSDLVLVRQGVPSYLMLIDGMAQRYPDDPQLLLAGAQAYSSYAAILEENEQGRAVSLYARAKGQALKALDLHPRLKGFQGQPLSFFQEQLAQTTREDVPLLFGAGSVWGGWIANSPDGVEAMAELPWVEAIMERVLQLDPGYYYGGAHLFKGILLSARPEQFGGNLKKADDHFQEAMRWGKGKFLMAEVYYAQYYARQRLDRDLFEKTLKRVQEAPADQDPDLTLLNTLAKQKAQKLLEQADEYF
ncbi:MAG: hypothetical protein EHM75_02565 [Desulfobacteraceae bacterium]|nr:MAG: hypothetical protein EHM75_02565 [Desulfobacteraceae bacterium]